MNQVQPFEVFPRVALGTTLLDTDLITKPYYTGVIIANPNEQCPDFPWLRSLKVYERATTWREKFIEAVKLLSAPSTSDPYRLIAIKAIRLGGPHLYRNRDVSGSYHDYQLEPGAPHYVVPTKATLLMRGTLESSDVEDEFRAGLPHAGKSPGFLTSRGRARLTVTAFTRLSRTFPY
jgi:hypothetical protein